MQKNNKKRKKKEKKKANKEIHINYHRTDLQNNICALKKMFIFGYLRRMRRPIV